jgi:hypothetical protein
VGDAAKAVSSASTDTARRAATVYAGAKDSLGGNQK